MIKNKTHKQIVQFAKFLKQERIEDIQSKEFIRHYFLWRSFMKFGSVLPQENPQTQKVFINTTLLQQIANSLYEIGKGKELLAHIKDLGFKTFEKNRQRHFQYWQNQKLANDEKMEVSNHFLLLLSCEKQEKAYLTYLKTMISHGTSQAEKRAIFLLTRAIMNTQTFQVNIPKLPEFKIQEDGSVIMRFKQTYSSAEFSFTTLDTISSHEALSVKIQHKKLRNGYWEDTVRSLTVDLRYVEDFFIQETDTWLNLHRELGV